MKKLKLSAADLEAILLGIGIGLILTGCSAPELQESSANAYDALLDAATKVASDPATATTPLGLAILGGTFVAGFASRQTASLAKWVGGKGGGALVKGLRKLKGEKPLPPPENPKVE